VYSNEDKNIGPNVAGSSKQQRIRRHQSGCDLARYLPLKNSMGNIMKSLKGIVIPIDWDADGNIVQTALMTFNEDMFIIADDHLGNMLSNCLRHIVTIDGEIVFSGPVKQIRIHRFTFDK
jgi:hypothetical protein